MIQGHRTSFTHRNPVDEVWARLGQGERRYDLDKWSRTVWRIDIQTAHYRAPTERGPNYQLKHYFVVVLDKSANIFTFKNLKNIIKACTLMTSKIYSFRVHFIHRNSCFFHILNQTSGGAYYTLVCTIHETLQKYK